MVTSGSAGAMAAATAACIAGSDPTNVWQLPDTEGLKHEVVMLEAAAPSIVPFAWPAENW